MRTFSRETALVYFVGVVSFRMSNERDVGVGA